MLVRRKYISVPVEVNLTLLYYRATGRSLGKTKNVTITYIVCVCACVCRSGDNFMVWVLLFHLHVVSGACTGVLGFPGLYLLTHTAPLPHKDGLKLDMP